MARRDLPAVHGVLSADDMLRTGRSIARAQESSGAIPWFAGGHVDPWDHVESAMALSATGLLREAEAAYDWSRRTQRADGSWPMKITSGRVDDAASDSNFCAYLAVGVWHHYAITGDSAFVARMWPVVRRAIGFVLDLQAPRGEIGWARGADGSAVPEALLTGCSSIHHSLRCALALAEHMGEPQPDWEVALGRLAHVVDAHPEAFQPKPRYSMDWYYPVLGTALRGAAAEARIDAGWERFVLPGLGTRCVDDRPWVTGGETFELCIALWAIGRPERARGLLADVRHLRDADGLYWTGYVYADSAIWPEEKTSWTAGSLLLALAVLGGEPATRTVFGGEALPAGLPAAIGAEGRTDARNRRTDTRGHASTGTAR